MTNYGEWLRGRGLSERTIAARLNIYQSRLDDWTAFDTVPPDKIATWLNQYSGWTKYTYFRHLTSIYDWMVELEQTGRNPMRHMKAPAPPRGRAKPLTEAQLAAALLAANTRTRTFIMLGYLAGLRAFEIAKFHGRDIDEQDLRVVGKGGVDDTLPTHPLLWELAQHYPVSGYWFPPLNRLGIPRGYGAGHVGSQRVTADVGALFRSLGIRGATHRARHTYGTQLLRGGANLRVVQELMRHRSLATTALYLGVDGDERVDAIGRLAA